MGLLSTIEVREVAAGWRVQQEGKVLVPPTTQDRAMIAALAEASARFDQGERSQVVVAPIVRAQLRP